MAGRARRRPNAEQCCATGVRRPSNLFHGSGLMDTVIVENETLPRSAISWPGILAGAAIATALSMAMLALGAGLGFSVMDPWAGNGALPSTTKAATVAG